MNRFESLISKLKEKFPNDQWIESWELVKHYDEWKPYFDALSILDEKSFNTIKTKLEIAFKEQGEPRGKVNFVSILNECFAYQYLQKKGFSQIVFLEESNKSKKNKPRSADIKYQDGDVMHYCEVKTIHISDDELKRPNGEVFSSSVYESLGEGFFNKLKHDIEKNARDQLNNAGLVFFVVYFDDFTHYYIEEYKAQLVNFFSNNSYQLDFIFKFGVHSEYYFDPIKNQDIRLN